MCFRGGVDVVTEARKSCRCRKSNPCNPTSSDPSSFHGCTIPVTKAAYARCKLVLPSQVPGMRAQTFHASYG
jgi:hypothetical protein